MRIKNKIYLLCMILCMITLTLAGILINENYHLKMLEKEIENCLSLEKNINIALSAYIINSWENELLGNNEVNADSRRLIKQIEGFVKEFSDKDIYFEVLNKDKEVMIRTHDYNWSIERNEIDTVLDGKRNYVIRKMDGKHFIFATDILRTNMNEDFIIVCIKDISYLFTLRRKQFIFFVWIEAVALIALLIAVNFLSRYITRPLEILTETTEKIASGSYYERVNFNSDDEIGILAKQFDRMASDIESKINELESQTEGKQRFIDDLTHELKTPLTSIIGYADLLRKNEYNKELYNKGLDHIYTEGKRINDLIRKMIDIILLRNMDIDIKEERVKEIFDEAIEVMKIKLNDKEIKTRIIGPDISIPMDKNLMKAVLINLLDNAYKASEKGQTIILSTKMQEDNRCISVVDEGKGMNIEEVKNIKEPFYKVDKSRNRNEGGIGLGLSICDEIVSLHGARLNIRSEEGNGTEIEIIF